jgi:hypothetical protein
MIKKLLKNRIGELWEEVRKARKRSVTAVEFAMHVKGLEIGPRSERV